MKIQITDILKQNNNFYYIKYLGYGFIIVNKILCDLNKKKLVLSHKNTFINEKDLDSYTHFKNDDPNIKNKLELLKRRTKLEKINNIKKS